MADTKTITLALQGGGAHGAFTWGVLDCLLSDPRVEIEAISATSAGAMNGAMAAYGMAVGGREGARAKLDEMWRRVSQASMWSLVWPTWADRMASGWGLSFSPMYQLGEAALRLWSPYQFNPLGFNPLRGLLAEMIDFERLRAASGIKLFVSATNVLTGRLRVFRHDEIDADVVMASACLPNLFQAVRIGDDYYWDGGYLANPALYPLMRYCASTEMVVVQVNPIAAREMPATAQAIFDRVNEISFNASVMHEMNALAYVTDLLDRGLIDPAAGIKRSHVHMIQDEEAMARLDSSSKFNAEWSFLEYLRQTGRAAAERWLADHWEDVGRRSTIAIGEL